MHRRFRALGQLTLVRYREFLRESEAVFWTFGFPLFLAIGLGIAFRHKPPEVLRIAVTGDTTRLLSAARGASGLAAVAMDSASAAHALAAGKLTLVAHAGRDSGAVTYEFDATRPEGLRARLLVNDALQRSAGRTDPVPVHERRITEVGSRYIDFFIPGLLGMNLMGSGIWGIAFSVVTARSRKLLKRLSATPMSRFDFLLSYMLSRLTFLVLEVLVLLGFGRFVFGVPMRGSPVALGVIALVGALAFSGLGLLIASRVRTIEAVSGLGNLAMVPMWILSGVFFSSANFPDVAQPFIRLLPLTAANDALRANMLQGAGLGDVWPQLVVLTVWLVVTTTVAVRIFKWR